MKKSIITLVIFVLVLVGLTLAGRFSKQKLSEMEKAQKAVQTVR